ncbi:hypothetical protein ACH5RR_014043 [Cinchona calisaya]|uniref:Uncharacterized protein n=1 Tax=Cinchona calisaya TaxID=153742 RepID=A0ABD3A444_9GENT
MGWLMKEWKGCLGRKEKGWLRKKSGREKMWDGRTREERRGWVVADYREGMGGVARVRRRRKAVKKLWSVVEGKESGGDGLLMEGKRWLGRERNAGTEVLPSQKL